MLLKNYNDNILRHFFIKFFKNKKQSAGSVLKPRKSLDPYIKKFYGSNSEKIEPCFRNYRDSLTLSINFKINAS